MLISRHSKLAIISILILISLFGCNKENQLPKKEDVKTVDWYLAHKDELNKQIKICTSNPGELEHSANCINAKSALLQTQTGTIHKVPF